MRSCRYFIEAYAQQVRKSGSRRKTVLDNVAFSLNAAMSQADLLP